MQVLTLRTPRPEAGTDVTRVWLGPGAARVAVVFGNGIPNNGFGLLRDAAGRTLWEADLQDRDDTYPDPGFDRDLARVAYTPAATDDAFGDTVPSDGPVVRDIGGGSEVRLAGDAFLPALAPDGRHAFAVAVPPAARGPRTLRRWPVPDAPGEGAEPLAADARWRVPLPVPSRLARQVDMVPQALAVSPDGAAVALGRGDGSITVWAVRGRREVLAVPPLKGTKYARFGVHRLALSADGRFLAAIRQGRFAGGKPAYQVHVWSLADGALQKGPKDKGSVHGAAFSPDGGTLLTARADGSVGEWDTATWKLRRAFAWTVGPLFSVAFAPDGLLCAAGGANGQVVVWDAG